MLKQKCKITALILALVFAVFACPLGILQVQAESIDSGHHQTEGAQTAETADVPDPEPPVSEPEPPPPSSEVEPPSSDPGSESSIPEEPSSSLPEPTIEPEPSEQEPTWAPDPTEAPNYNEGNTATATPRPTRSPSSSSNSAGITRPTATLKPDGGADSSQSEQKESNYVTFATMNVRQNSFATSLFYGGVACIFLGAVGLVVLIILFIKNRRSRKNEERDGIFEEIEQAEMRGKAEQSQATQARPSQTQHSGQISRPPARRPEAPAQPPQQVNRSDRPAIKPADISMYTEEIDIPAPKQTAPRSSAPPADNRPVPPKTPPANPSNAGDRPFDTEEILREALYQDDDYDDL